MFSLLQSTPEARGFQFCWIPVTHSFFAHFCVGFMFRLDELFLRYFSPLIFSFQLKLVSWQENFISQFQCSFLSGCFLATASATWTWLWAGDLLQPWLEQCLLLMFSFSSPFSSALLTLGMWDYIVRRWNYIGSWQHEKKILRNGFCVIEIIFNPENPKCVLIRNEFISKAQAALDGDLNNFLSTRMPFPVQCAVTLGANTSELPGRAEGFSDFRVIQFKRCCHSICSLKLFPTQTSPFRVDMEEA